MPVALFGPLAIQSCKLILITVPLRYRVAHDFILTSGINNRSGQSLGSWGAVTSHWWCSWWWHRRYATRSCCQQCCLSCGNRGTRVIHNISTYPSTEHSQAQIGAPSSLLRVLLYIHDMTDRGLSMPLQSSWTEKYRRGHDGGEGDQCLGWGDIQLDRLGVDA